jgi:hypothetical protein
LRHRQPEPDNLVEDAAKPRDEKKEEKPAHARLSSPYGTSSFDVDQSLSLSFEKQQAL